MQHKGPERNQASLGQEVEGARGACAGIDREGLWLPYSLGSGEGKEVLSLPVN